MVVLSIWLRQFRCGDAPQVRRVSLEAMKSHMSFVMFICSDNLSIMWRYYFFSGIKIESVNLNGCGGIVSVL